MKMETAAGVDIGAGTEREPDSPKGEGFQPSCCGTLNRDDQDACF